jgi:hypothetical protein
MTYVDGFVAAVPTANRETYRKHAGAAAVVFTEHGALKLVEYWDDPPTAIEGSRRCAGEAGEPTNRHENRDTDGQERLSLSRSRAAPSSVKQSALLRRSALLLTVVANP